jgi:hypothetical protein
MCSQSLSHKVLCHLYLIYAIAYMVHQYVIGASPVGIAPAPRNKFMQVMAQIEQPNFFKLSVPCHIVYGSGWSKWQVACQLHSVPCALSQRLSWSAILIYIHVDQFLPSWNGSSLWHIYSFFRCYRNTCLRPLKVSARVQELHTTGATAMESCEQCS